MSDAKDENAVIVDDSDVSSSEASKDFNEAQQLDSQTILSPDDEIDDVETGESLAGIRLRIEKSKADRREQSNKLRAGIGVTATVFVGIQLVTCDVLVYSYVFQAGKNVDSSVMIAWMSASLVEVIGILWVIARSLFPFHDRHRDKNAEHHTNRRS